MSLSWRGAAVTPDGERPSRSRGGRHSSPAPTPGESDVVVCHGRPTAATVTVEWDHDGKPEQAK